MKTITCLLLLAATATAAEPDVEYSPKIPLNLKVTVAGVANNKCADCNKFNGTYVLPIATKPITRIKQSVNGGQFGQRPEDVVYQWVEREYPPSFFQWRLLIDGCCGVGDKSLIFVTLTVANEPPEWLLSASIGDSTAFGGTKVAWTKNLGPATSSSPKWSGVPDLSGINLGISPSASWQDDCKNGSAVTIVAQ